MEGMGEGPWAGKAYLPWEKRKQGIDVTRAGRLNCFNSNSRKWGHYLIEVNEK